MRWLHTNLAEVISLGNLIVLGTQIATTASCFNQFKSLPGALLVVVSVPTKEVHFQKI